MQEICLGRVKVVERADGKDAKEQGRLDNARLERVGMEEWEVMVEEVEVGRQVLVDGISGGQINVFIPQLGFDGVSLAVAGELGCFWKGQSLAGSWRAAVIDGRYRTGHGGEWRECVRSGASRHWE